MKKISIKEEEELYDKINAQLKELSEDNEMNILMALVLDATYRHELHPMDVVQVYIKNTGGSLQLIDSIPLAPETKH